MRFSSHSQRSRNSARRSQLLLETLEDRCQMHHCHISFANATFSAGESSGSAIITLTRTEQAGDISIDFNASVGTADGSDFTPIVSETIPWSNAEANIKIVTVNITSDMLVEGDETINLSIDNFNGTFPGAITSATLTIVDDDSPVGAPVIDNFGTAVEFIENGAPSFVAGSAMITDSDSADFDTGALTLQYTSGGSADDRLAISNLGPVTTNVNNEVFYNATMVGTIAGGIGTTPLVVTFNANATPDIAAAVLQGIAYSNVSDGPTATRTLSVQISDGDGQTSLAVTKDINVTAVNDAPVLDISKNPTLPRVSEGVKNPAGVLISRLIAGAVTDPDLGVLKGIAIVSAPNIGGEWQFTISGGSEWVSLTGVSATAAKVLAVNANTRVRFLPTANGFGVKHLQFKAWDQTQGQNFQTLDTTTSSGGENSCSTATETASIVVNDVPVLAGLGGPIRYVRGTPPVFLVPAVTVADADSPNFAGGRLVVHFTGPLDTSNRLAIGGRYKLVGTKVMFGSTVIGERLLVPSSGQDLYIQFNTHATRRLVQGLTQSITFHTEHGAAGKRHIVFTVSDGDGGTSVAKTKIVNVL